MTNLAQLKDRLLLLLLGKHSGATVKEHLLLLSPSDDAAMTRSTSHPLWRS